MKTSTILASCALALLNTPSCLATLLNDTPVITPDHLTLDNISSTQNITTRGEESVPFTTCRDFNSTNSGFIVNEILLSPNPPVRGQDLDITVKGDLRTNLDKGAAVRVAVWKFGMPFVYLEVSSHTHLALKASSPLSQTLPPGHVAPRINGPSYFEHPSSSTLKYQATDQICSHKRN